ncbi:MAG TPA: hypothetical protein VJX23_04180 [Candidatus Binataceae bacterium]|nr:hypothetical protein [Candidatus Binataceae bacterium]
MKILRAGSIGVVMATALVALAPRIASACAMCGLPPGDAAGHAYNASVLFMLIGPYFTVAAMAGVLFAIYKRAQRKEQASAVSGANRR